MSLKFILLILFAFSACSLFSQGEEKNLFICKTAEPIILDGELNEETWKQAIPAGNFWQNFPYDTSLSVTKTIVYVTYNKTAFYVASICYDDLPGDYVIQSLKRDFAYASSDAFRVIIDPFSDKQNGFSFAVNPYGVQSEGLLASGGGSGATLNWDNKWDCKVKKYNGYWIVEMEIPFKTIRYKNDITHWHINFTRNDLKRNEGSTWCKVPRQFNTTSLAFTGNLFWDSIPNKAGTNISIIPYGIGKMSKDFISNTPTKYEYGVGGDAKIALSSSMNLDLTVNPDFSQVEVDRQLTNLTRFSLFFPEQRQFFIENSDLFANFGFRQIRPFFSRRIGLSGGEVVPIIAGARLSGKPNKNWRIGIMDIQTANTTINNSRVFSQNYFVAAAQRNIFKRSNIAMIAVNRQQFDTGFYSLTNFNRVLGLDYNLLSDNNKWMGKFFFHHSFSNKLNHNAFTHASWLSYNTRALNVHWNHEYVDKNYNAETGFTPRIFQTDLSRNLTTRNTYWRLEPMVFYHLYPKNSIINKMGPRIYLDHYMNDKYTTTDVYLQNGYDINFANTASLSFDYQYFYTKLIYPTDVSFTGMSSAIIGDYEYSDGAISFKTNQRKLLSGSGKISYGQYFTGSKLSYTGELLFRKQPYAIISLSYTRNEIILPNLAKPVTLDLIGPRIELSFTKSLFLTTFLQYNSQINNFNVNARLQYRFKPMSDLFIVYSDNYISDNLKQKNRALVLKFVYWFSV